MIPLRTSLKTHATPFFEPRSNLPTTVVGSFTRARKGYGGTGSKPHVTGSL